MTGVFYMGLVSLRQYGMKAKSVSGQKEIVRSHQLQPLVQEALKPASHGN